MTRDAHSLNDDTHAVLDRAVRSASVTRAVAVARGAIGQLPRLLSQPNAAGACLIVADPATLHAAGHAAIAALRGAGIAVSEPIILDEAPRVKPRIELARDLAARFAQMKALPIAVGAGVISDVTKCAAGIAGVPYASVATAARRSGERLAARRTLRRRASSTSSGRTSWAFVRGALRAGDSEPWLPKSASTTW